jgi:hypothetical protein
LSFATNEAGTIWFTAVAWLWISTVSVNVVVEDKFLAGLNAPLGKYSHAKFIAHNPFIDVAIWIAGMIAETTKVTLLSRINELALRKGHKIKMFDALLIVLDSSASESRLVDDFSDVFENEIIRVQVRIRP